MQLPSAAVARHGPGSSIEDDKLKVGKANEEMRRPTGRLPTFSPLRRKRAPLVLRARESAQQFKKNETPIHLGPVGGRLVGEVFS